MKYTQLEMDIPSMSDSQGNQKVIFSRGKCLLYVDNKFAHRYFYSEKRQMVLELVCSIHVYRFSLQATPTLQAQLLHNKPR